ncbi:MAG: hypothetical protein F4144_15805 [Acidimicrobiaceae bacterium]|nr:hypothetical protein [Acidobacteriota bacterium]MYH00933.1 hypothetical protein [Acidimicrobiaceae bacterium]
MAAFEGVRVTRKGHLRLPERVRRRWGLQDGDVVDCLDLGDAVVIVREGIEPGSFAMLESIPHVDGHASEPPRWPPRGEAVFRLDVRGDAWDVRWGRYDDFGTPAWWIDQTRTGGYTDAYAPMDVVEAVVWGLLHGGGIKAESGDAFLEPVMALLQQQPDADADAIESVLRTPVAGVGRYRFPNKCAYIAAAVDALERIPPPDNPAQLRRYLLDLRGVGPKTASLIVTAVTGGNAPVHINDIWLRRALTPSGIFRSEWQVEHDYDRFEEAFLQYARHGQVKPGALDWCIWELARQPHPEAKREAK